MKDKTNVGFSLHKRVMETCHVPRIILLVNTTGGSRGGGGCGGCNPPLIFKKRSGHQCGRCDGCLRSARYLQRVNRNGTGRRDVEVSLLPPGHMQLDAYHVRRGFVQKTANKVVFIDQYFLNVFFFAYPFPDVAASTSFPNIPNISFVFLCFFCHSLFLLVGLSMSSMFGFVYMSELTYILSF